MPSGGMESTIPAGSTFVVTATHEFKPNDIVVFTGPTAVIDPGVGRSDPFASYISRIIGGPGDSVNISAGAVFLNGQQVNESPLFQHSWRISSNRLLDNDSLHIRETDWIVVRDSAGDGKYHFFAQLSNKKAADILHTKEPGIWLQRAPDSLVNEFITKAGEEGRWSPDFYGPFSIPLPGDSLWVNEANRRFYQLDTTLRDGWNIVKNRLYFLLGDNRNESNDSRYYGLVPETLMTGIVK